MSLTSRLIRVPKNYQLRLFFLYFFFFFFFFSKIIFFKNNKLFKYNENVKNSIYFHRFKKIKEEQLSLKSKIGGLCSQDRHVPPAAILLTADNSLLLFECMVIVFVNLKCLCFELVYILLKNNKLVSSFFNCQVRLIDALIVYLVYFSRSSKNGTKYKSFKNKLNIFR